jgi:hypothetical protein
MGWFMSAVHTFGGCFSSLWNTLISAVGFSIAAIIAIIKADVNGFIKIFCLLLMFISCLYALVRIYEITAHLYAQIITAVSQKSTPFIANIVASFSVVILAYIFRPVIFILCRLAFILPAATLYICGHKEVVSLFMVASSNRELYAITSS